jgi:hypothetical protein
MRASSFSYKRADLINLPEHLALCLVMLALLPANARPQPFLRVNAIAREAAQARKHLRQQLAAQRLPGFVFFKACPAANGSSQLSGPQITNAGRPCAHREQAHQGTDHVDGRPEYPAQAVRVCSLKQPNVLNQRVPATSDEEMEPLTSSPFHNNGTEEPGSDMRKRMMWLSFGETSETQQGEEFGDPSADAGHPEKEDGGADACTIRQGPRRMRDGDEGGQLDNAGGACKVARRSMRQKVCPPTCSRR